MVAFSRLIVTLVGGKMVTHNSSEESSWKEATLKTKMISKYDIRGILGQ
jgi:hypothetical protein